jgi:ABC-type phosphate transport system auxiliary subunit
LAGRTLRHRIPAVEDLKSQLDLNHKRELLQLRQSLDRLKWFEDEAADMEAILDDPDRGGHHEAAKKRLEAIQSVVGTYKELVEVTIELIGLTGDRAELQRQLDAPGAAE